MKRFRSLLAGGARVTTTCSFDSCCLVAEETKVSRSYGTQKRRGEAQIEGLTSFCAVCLTSIGSMGNVGFLLSCLC